MNLILSRRVGRVMLAKPIAKLWPKQQAEFAVAVGKAGSFEELPQRWRDLILAAEKEVRTGISVSG